MPGFSTKVPHQLGQEAARQRLESFLDTVREKYKDQVKNVEGQWNDHKLDFSFTTFGMKISGIMTVEEDHVLMDGTIPFAAIAFRGQIEQSIRDGLEKALA